MAVFAERTELIKPSLYSSLQLCFSAQSDSDPAANWFKIYKPSEILQIDTKYSTQQHKCISERLMQLAAWYCETPGQSSRNSGNKCQLARPLTMPNFIAIG